jgi:2-methylcitrate dehydratase PrpD
VRAIQEVDGLNKGETVRELMMGHTRTIVQYSCSLTYERLPVPVVAAARTVVLDTLGALFAAWPTRHPAPRIVADYVKDMGGRAECTVLGAGFRAPAPEAALVNGVMGYAADIEGGILRRPPIHAAAVAVPVALVMAERQACSGRQFLTALVLGYDVMDRVSKASATPRSYPHSFHPSAVFGAFGATAIGGHLLGLDESQFINAYGLVGNVAGGLIAWVDDPTEHSRPFGVGLASRGFGGPQGVFDGSKYNIFDAYSGAMNLAEVTRDLGTDFALIRHEGFKKYPCCNDIHSGLDALLQILAEHRIETSQIESIVHYVREDRRPVIDNNPLKSHNAQYILSVAAVERRLRWDDFLKDRRSEPEIGRLYARTHLLGAEELDRSPFAEPAIVEVQTVGGQRYVQRVDAARGHLGNPLTEEELREKFASFAVPIVGVSSARRIVDMVDHLEELADIRELIELLG